MKCRWRLHSLLSDLSDKSKREEQFSCPLFEQIALSVDVGFAKTDIYGPSMVMVQSFSICF